MVRVEVAAATKAQVVAIAMTAKTPAERKAAQRQRNAEAGLVRIELYAHPEDHDALKALAEKLRRKREKAHGRTTSRT